MLAIIEALPWPDQGQQGSWIIDSWDKKGGIDKFILVFVTSFVWMYLNDLIVFKSVDHYKFNLIRIFFLQ